MWVNTHTQTWLVACFDMTLLSLSLSLSWCTQDASDQCPSDDKESSEGEGEGDSIVQEEDNIVKEEDMTVVPPEDASSGDQ